MTRKKRIGILCAVLVPAVTLCTGAYAVYSYSKSNFSGTVVDKYRSEVPFQGITVKSNHIVIASWFGEKDFCVKDDIYSELEVGGEYSFQKYSHIDWVSLK